MLEIIDLHASIDNKVILNGINLKVNLGEVHAIMGPNGSGKSTLSNVIAGHDGYDIISGDIRFAGESVLDLPPEKRAHLGLFLSFQYPVEIPGVTVSNFIRTALNEIRNAKGQEPLGAPEMLKSMREKMKILEMDKGFLSRSLNDGFSGGEKKRNEIFQMAMLNPKLCILDETDSGLDIDALRVVSEGVNAMRNKERSFLIITHYQRLLDYIQPDFVHVMYNGRIVKSGDKSLAKELEEKGYDWIKEEVS